MIVLSKDEIADRLRDTSTIATALVDAYVAASSGAIELPPIGHLTFPTLDADCHIKYGHRRGDDVFVVKIATGFPENARRGSDNSKPSKPVNNGASLVLSAETGELKAVLHDEMLMTDIRTGIGGAIASQALSRSDATKLLVVGSGTQARQQIDAHRKLLDRPLDVTIWGRSQDQAARVAQDLGNVHVARDLGAACAHADIIVTTTAARVPLIDDQSVRAGSHITAVGADAPGKHELDAALLTRADLLVADSRSQCFDHGELSVMDPESTSVAELGEILSGRHAGRQHRNEITVADLTGIAAQDIAIAAAVLG